MILRVHLRWFVCSWPVAKVCVLADGVLEQYGPPAELLKEEAGIFYNLVEETGPAVRAHLHELANAKLANSSPPDLSMNLRI